MSEGPRDLVLTTPPTAELVTLTEVKAHLRMEGITDRDSTLQAHLDAAIAELDGYAGLLGRALATQTWTLYLDRFPAFSCGGPGNTIRLPLPPLISVSSVKYVDGDGVEQTLTAGTDYEVFAGERAEIRPAYGKTWPSPRGKARAVTIVFVAGYAVVSTGVWPKKLHPVLSAVKLRVEQLFRGEDPAREAAIANLLRPLKIPRT
jgi:uncharacterized phiE125 gp8 family phage protein